MRILLIWEQIPESLQVYSLDVSEFEGERIRKLSGKYVNLADNTPEEEEELNWLSVLLQDRQEDIVFDNTSGDKLRNVILRFPEIHLVCTGFIM